MMLIADVSNNAIATLRRRMTVRGSSGPAPATSRTSANTGAQAPLRVQRTEEPTTTEGSTAAVVHPTGSSGVQAIGQRSTDTQGTQSTGVGSVPERANDPSSDQAIATTIEIAREPRVTRRTRPSRIPRLSGGPVDLNNQHRNRPGVAGGSHEVGVTSTGQPVPHSTVVSQAPRAIGRTRKQLAEHLKETRVLSSRPTVKE